MASCSDKTPPAFDQKVDDYNRWKKCFKLWQNVTEVAPNKQASLLILRLDNETRDEILDTVSDADISSAEGVKKVLDQLDKTFTKDETVIKYETYEMFATYRRPKSMKIKEYVTEFQKRLKKIIAAD